MSSGQSSPVASNDYYSSRPQHLASGGVIFRDEAERVLLVRPTYLDAKYRGKEKWELPGGGAEQGEFPIDTARREIKEELGLDVIPGRLLVVDCVPSIGGRRPLINFLFDGGTLTPEQERAIELKDGELSEWDYSNRDDYVARLDDHMSRRIDACVVALRTGTTGYLHHGYPVGH
ncbi:NUDIX domain-containing protein [Amycolatopsis sp. RTGN1]|uniref:NUDIX domain-containing protein n=1 Tax=Amycolatopsis ponsaeliensis TaxID=2992142 RepID=UPI00254D143C|nr:NUDIX hydrolase [Amycolatopsis sp. RTGN1]